MHQHLIIIQNCKPIFIKFIFGKLFSYIATENLENCIRLKNVKIRVLH